MGSEQPASPPTHRKRPPHKQEPGPAPRGYRGRFAPSPTGPLHFGSLIAALASYLDARHHGGEWLLRIEDLDPPREVPGSADRIQQSLEQHGLLWDALVWQSQRHDAYDAALARLGSGPRLFRCCCTRSQLGPGGACGRQCSPAPGDACALRFELDGTESFDDFLLGPQDAVLSGDIALRRRDGLYAYALAVVVDDASQGITHVLRGRDLLEQTGAQISLFRHLGHEAPAYGHIPLLVDASGNKLSKQTGAAAIDDERALDNLRTALTFLGQDSARADASSVTELLELAVPAWHRDPLAKRCDQSLAGTEARA